MVLIFNFLRLGYRLLYHVAKFNFDNLKKKIRVGVLLSPKHCFYKMFFVHIMYAELKRKRLNRFWLSIAFLTSSTIVKRGTNK